MFKVPSMEELLEAGVHFGHQVRRGNPKMNEYIFGVREGVHIINLESSEKMLQEAAEHVKKLGSEGKVILFLGTKKQAQPIIKEAAESVGTPYINFRWLGGLLTNFDEIRRNINKLVDLKNKKQQGELTHYTKKEQLLISRKLEKFDLQYGGIESMDKLPDAIFVADSASEVTALAEANRLNIPVIGIADTNSDPTKLTKVIPGNDDAIKSIQILIKTIANAYLEGLKSMGRSKEDTVSKESKTKEKNKTSEAEIDVPVLEQVAAAEEEVEKKTIEEAKRPE